MKREFIVTLDDVEYPVVAEDDKIIVNDRSFTVEITEEGAVLVDGIVYDVSLEEDTARISETPHSVQVSGLSVESATSAPPSGPVGTPKSEAGAGAILAIMPGQVTRVMVEPGQKVQNGEPVCVLEAMKMENELHAQQDGVVRAVHVEAGDDVEKDQVLVEIE